MCQLRLSRRPLALQRLFFGEDGELLRLVRLLSGEVQEGIRRELLTLTKPNLLRLHAFQALMASKTALFHGDLIIASLLAEVRISFFFFLSFNIAQDSL